MYLLIEGDQPKTHKVIYCPLHSAETKHIKEDNSEYWKLIGITEKDDDICIAKFATEDHAYKALSQLFNHITNDAEQWDVVEYKQYLESDEQGANPFEVNI